LDGLRTGATLRVCLVGPLFSLALGLNEKGLLLLFVILWESRGDLM
jgi:hypothetical protein